LTAALAAVFLLLPAVSSFSQDQEPERPVLRSNRGQELLGLTQEQMDGLNRLRAEHQKERLALTDKIRLLSLENRQLMRDPEANTAKIKELRREIFDLRERVFDQSLAHRKARNALLTPEQLERMRTLQSRVDRLRRPGRRDALLRQGRRGRAAAGMRSRLPRPGRTRLDDLRLGRRIDRTSRIRDYQDQ
jgi:hypothetical protein